MRKLCIGSVLNAIYYTAWYTQKSYSCQWEFYANMGSRMWLGIVAWFDVDRSCCIEGCEGNFFSGRRGANLLPKPITSRRLQYGAGRSCWLASSYTNPHGTNSKLGKEGGEQRWKTSWAKVFPYRIWLYSNLQVIVFKGWVYFESWDIIMGRRQILCR